MATIEERLEFLEKQSETHHEFLAASQGYAKAIGLIAESAAIALASEIEAVNEFVRLAGFVLDKKPVLQKIIDNLKTLERLCREGNEHALTMQRLRTSREFFERRLKETEINEKGPPDQK
jgi:hypothetical protein